MRRSFASLVIVTALGIPPAVSAGVRLISVKSPVQVGAKATVTVSVSPARLCSITISNGAGAYQSSDLRPKSATKGQVSWTWKVGKNMALGTWKVKVSCGSAGSLTTSIQVVAYPTVHR